MAAILQTSPNIWEGKRDDEGQRVYYVTHRVRTTSSTDGPAVVMNTSGLPLIGSGWNFGGGEFDLWAFCYPWMEVNAVIDGEANTYWTVKQKFGTRPMRKCQDATVDDPLLEPQKVSGTFVRQQKEMTIDRNGDAIQMISHEPIKGSQGTFSEGYPTVRIEQNVGALGLCNFAQMVFHVNSLAMWNLAVRCVLLTNATWRRQVNGMCDFYYTRVFDFEINYSTWDREVPSKGNLALNGHQATEEEKDLGQLGWRTDLVDGGAPDITNPTHFVQYVDKTYNATFCYHKADGNPLTDMDDLQKIKVEYYPETNLFLLGVPATF